MRAATLSSKQAQIVLRFQSTPPVRAATSPRALRRSWASISIHAAREGGDALLRELPFRTKISIHAAREGGDSINGTDKPGEELFQSTPPVRAATREREITRPRIGISIHAAREGGDCVRLGWRSCRKRISIHAAREGGDSIPFNINRKLTISIHAAREGGDILKQVAVRPAVAISIHAAREGGDRRRIIPFSDTS